jgi:hypothetical protein
VEEIANLIKETAAAGAWDCWRNSTDQRRSSCKRLRMWEKQQRSKTKQQLESKLLRSKLQMEENSVCNFSLKEFLDSQFMKRGTNCYSYSQSKEASKEGKSCTIEQSGGGHQSSCSPILHRSWFVSQVFSRINSQLCFWQCVNLLLSEQDFTLPS